MTWRDGPEPEPWSTRSSRPVYANPWITVREDVARMPDGRDTVYGVVRCAGAVGVLPFVTDDHVLLVRQWRYVAGQATWEIPTGGIEPGEPLAHAAQRELAEETGMRAGSLESLGAFHTSKSVVDETATLFIARDLVPHHSPPDNTEFIRRAVVPFADVIAMVLSGEILDAMTIIAVLRAERDGLGRRQ